jgi:hypothetical protein
MLPCGQPSANMPLLFFYLDLDRSDLCCPVVKGEGRTRVSMVSVSLLFRRTIGPNYAAPYQRHPTQV